MVKQSTPSTPFEKLGEDGWISGRGDRPNGSKADTWEDVAQLQDLDPQMTMDDHREDLLFAGLAHLVLDGIGQTGEPFGHVL